MAELNTKTIDELETIESMGENDKVLVASGGEIKKVSGSLGGGGGLYFINEFVDVEFSGYGTVSCPKITPNEIIALVNSGMLPVLVDNSDDYAAYTMIMTSYEISNGGYFSVYFGNNRQYIQPDNMDAYIHVYLD